MREGKKKKKKEERKEGERKAKNYQLPPFRLVSERKRREKKILGKKPVCKEHDLCSSPNSKECTLLSEETPKHGTRGHRLALPDTAAGVAMATTKLVSLHFPRSGSA